MKHSFEVLTEIVALASLGYEHRFPVNCFEKTRFDIDEALEEPDVRIFTRVEAPFRSAKKANGRSCSCGSGVRCIPSRKAAVEGLLGDTSQFYLALRDRITHHLLQVVPATRRI